MKIHEERRTLIVENVDLVLKGYERKLEKLCESESESESDKRRWGFS